MTIFEVRPEAGLQRAPEGDGRVAASHAAVQTVLREPGWSSDARMATGYAEHQAGLGIPEVAGELLSKVLLFMDAPDHTRLRGLVSKAFTPRSVERLRPRIGGLTEELLAPLRQAGRFDVIDDLAFALPVTVICELLGVPAEDRDMFRQQTRDLAVVLDWDVTPEQFGGAAGAALNFAAYLVPLFEERRRSPQADLISALVAAEEAGDRLGADELLTTVVLLLTAGHETTMNLIGNGLLALLRNPDQLELLRARPELMPSAVEELTPPARLGTMDELKQQDRTESRHPAPFTDSIIDALAELILAQVPSGWIIHDPFGGEGVRLGTLCDRIGYEFSGTDLEPWLGGDPRVHVGDSTVAGTYPLKAHAVVTSPTYNNGVNDHFLPKDESRRLTYRVAAGRPLHLNNTGRYSGRGSKKGEGEYWRITRDVVKCWPSLALVNVKDSTRGGEAYPLVQLWTNLLDEHGYEVTRIDVECPGWRFGSNHEARTGTEAILIAKLTAS